MDPGKLAQLMNDLQNGNKVGQDGQNEESLGEDEKMENIRMTYDLFVQNSFKYTSHSIEWLPISHTDPDNQKFDYQYFLFGTHIDDRSEGENQEPDKLQFGRMRIPNRKLCKNDIEEMAQTHGM